jgi:hypothetical protein
MTAAATNRPMKSNFTKRTFACSLTTLGVIFASAHAQANQNPSIGTWKLNLEESILDLSGPGFEGMTGSVTLLPSGIIDAKLSLPDGTYENKFCIMGVSLRKQTCLATVTSPRGDVVFFKQVLDKQD